MFLAFQAQLASMVSSLNSTQTDVEVKQDEVDDLQEYLPEVNDEQTRKILEEGAELHDAGDSKEDEVTFKDKFIEVQCLPITSLLN